MLRRSLNLAQVLTVAWVLFVDVKKLHLFKLVLQYITWLSDNKSVWTIRAGGLGQNENVQISARPVPQEPMVSLDYRSFPSRPIISPAFDHQPRNVEKLWPNRLCASHFPKPSPRRLYSSLSKTERYQHRLRSERFSDGRLHQPVRCH